MSDKFIRSGHVDAVNVGVANRWRSGGKIDPLGARFPGHLDDLPTCGSPHNGIINKQDSLILKFKWYRIQFLSDRLLTLALPRHDKSPTDVTVFHEPFAKFDPQFVCQ